MEWHEKKFGWLWKNVGGHFLCLFHDLYVNFSTPNQSSVQIISDSGATVTITRYL